MKRTWLFFCQTITVLLAAYFIVATLQPAWLSGTFDAPNKQGVNVIQAPLIASPSASFAGSFREAAKNAAPAVVSINTSKAAQRHPRSNDPWFQFFFGEQNNRPQTGLGSGVIISPEGYVLTNHHVIQGADEIEVILNDQRRALASVIGTDADTDMAVLKIQLPNLPVITLGNSDALQVGDSVLAIGNPFGVGQTVTSGIVSALERNQLGLNTFENFIQTDAAINPGNSGGALVDVNGHLMGINTAIYSRSGGSLGIGFAIPVSTAKLVFEAIVQHGAVARGWIGIEPNELTPELARIFKVKSNSGVLVSGILNSGPAGKAGMQPGDIITQVGEKNTTNVAELLAAIAALTPGQAYPLSLIRQGQPLLINLTPGTRPAK